MHLRFSHPTEGSLAILLRQLVFNLQTEHHIAPELCQLLLAEQTLLNFFLKLHLSCKQLLLGILQQLLQNFNPALHQTQHLLHFLRLTGVILLLSFRRLSLYDQRRTVRFAWRRSKLRPVCSFARCCQFAWQLFVLGFKLIICLLDSFVFQQTLGELFLLVLKLALQF